MADPDLAAAVRREQPADGGGKRGPDDAPPDMFVTIADDGDLVLRVTFLTSKEIIRAARAAPPAPVVRHRTPVPASARRRPGPGVSTTSTSSTPSPTPTPTQPSPPPPPPPVLKPRLVVAFRVQLSALTGSSRYFRSLLSNTSFQEGRHVAAALADLAARKLSLSDAASSAELDPAAAVADLPVVELTDDDDDATQSAGHERAEATANVLRALHRRPLEVSRPGMARLAALAITADRLDCCRAVADALRREGGSGGSGVDLKYGRWPVTKGKLLQPARRGDPAVVVAAATTTAASDLDGGGGGARPQPPRPRTDQEALLRQKILVGWLLDQPLRFAAATRELIFAGSVRWSAAMLDEGERYDGEEAAAAGVWARGGPTTAAAAAAAAQARSMSAAWWNLPDGLERELQHRRDRILDAVASVQRHFLALYASGARQCQLGYDSSGACDMFQLGQLLRFLASRELLWVVDLGPSSVEAVPDRPVADVEEVIATLKQCPSYQLDKNHINCGARKRMEPVLDYVHSMLSSNVVPVSAAEWRKDRAAASWTVDPEEGRDGMGGGGGGRGRGSLGWAGGAGDGEEADRSFKFTRQVAGDQRFRFQGAMYGDKMARKLFTADAWDWTAEQ